MPTGTAGTNARLYHQTMVHYLRKAVSFSDGNGAVITVGTIPAGSLVLRGMVAVTTAFNAGTANTIHVGTVADNDGFATALALGTIGNIVFDEMATTNDQYVTTDTVITATLTVSGTAATTGTAIIVVEFVPDNDG